MSDNGNLAWSFEILWAPESSFNYNRQLSSCHRVCRIRCPCHKLPYSVRCLVSAGRPAEVKWSLFMARVWYKVRHLCDVCSVLQPHSRHIPDARSHLHRKIKKRHARWPSSDFASEMVIVRSNEPIYTWRQLHL